MPFDPSASFTVVEEPPEATGTGFDPNKPFTVVEEPAVPSGPTMQPAIPAPGESSPGAFARPMTPVAQAFPVQGQAMQAAQLQQEERIAQLPEAVERAKSAPPPGPEPEIQPIGEEGTVLRGVTSVAASVLNRPEYIAALLNPATAVAVGSAFVPHIAKQFREDVIAAEKGDREALGRAMAIGLPVLAGIARGVRPRGGVDTRLSPAELAPMDAMARQAISVKDSPGLDVSRQPFEYLGEQDYFRGLDEATAAKMREAGVRNTSLFNLTEDVPGLGPKGSTFTKETLESAGFKPEAPLLKRSDAELKALTGERTTDAKAKEPTPSEISPEQRQPVVEPPKVEVDTGTAQRSGGDDAGAKAPPETTQRDVVPEPKKPLPEWLVEAMRREGKDPKRVFNDVDLGNPSIREAIQSDPTLTGSQKEHLLRTGSLPPAEKTPQRDVVGITAEAAELLEKGGTPAVMTRNLERIARENGIEVTASTTPNQVVDGLRSKAQAAVPLSEPIGGKEVPKPAEPTPEIVGMGGAVPSEFVPESRTATGIKNAAVDAERQSRGLQPVMRPSRLSNQVVWDEAMAKIDRDPTWQDRLIRELKENARTPNADEVVALDHRYVDLRNEYAKATREAAQAADDGRMADLAEAQARIAEWDAKLTELELVAHNVGTAWGRSGQMRQRLMREDFTLEAMESQYRQAKGFEPLTETERAQIKRTHDELQAKLKQLDERLAAKEKQFTEADAARVMAELKAQAAGAKYEPRVLQMAERFATTMDEKGAAALARIREKLRNVGAGVDPTLLADVAIYGASKITRGLTEFAKWGDEMVRELGDWIKPHLDEAWKAAQKSFETDLDTFSKPIGRAAAKVKEAVKTQATQNQVEKITSQLKTAAEAKDMEGVGRLARRLAREMVAGGIKEWKPLVESVHAQIQKIVPEFTERQTMDAISGYGDFKRLSMDEVSVLLRDLKGQLQQIAKLEDMASGVAPKKTGVERRVPSDAERRLIQQVNEAKKKGGFKVTDPATQLRTALQAIKTRLENQISDLSQQLATRTQIIKERRRVEYDAQATELKRRRDELKAQYDEMFPKAPITDAQRLANWKTRAQKRIKDLNERIANKDLEPRKRKPVELDKEAFQLELQIEDVKRRFNEELVNQRMARRGATAKFFGGIAEGINTTRSLLTSADLSAVLRQGGFIGLGHPLRSARSVPAMLRALVSKEAAAAVELQIRKRDNYQLYRQAKLELTEQGHSLTKMEEAFMSRLAGKLPFGIGKLVEGSQRAYTTFLNKLRADSFDAMVKTLSRDGRTVTPAEAKIIANYINVATGRGQIGAKANMAAGLNTVFFAPRFVASRFQLALGQPIWHGIASGGKIPFKDTAKVRRLVALEYARFLGGAAFVYALGSVLGGEVETDPRSSDFGKLRFGDTRIDMLGGLQQASVFLSRSISGETKTGGGRVLPIRGDLPYGSKSWSDIAFRFARTKFSPVFAAGWDTLTGRNVVEEDVTVGSTIKRLTIPISFQEVGTLMEEQGVPKGLAMFFLSLFGAGVQTYKDQ